MFEGIFKPITNAHAFQSLEKPVHIPGARLGVGDGESLHSYAMKAQIVNGKQTVVVPELHSRSFEQAHIDGQGAAINPEDFPRLNHIGDPLGGTIDV